MSVTAYSTLYPTGDAVTYDNASVQYPASNVVDTFGQIWVSKVHGYEMNVLEVASAGKIAFTPGDEHSLDLLLDKGQGDVKLQSRNQNALALENEGSTGRLAIADDGSVTVSASDGGALLQMDAAGNLFQAGGVGDNRYVVPTARSHCFTVGATQVMCIEEEGASVSNLTVNGTDFRVPVGALGARPAGTDGQIFYNEDTGRFEGFASGAWSGLGGTIDVDQDTYVSAETAPGADNDQLLFVTAGTERLRVGSDGRVGYGTTAAQYDLDWRGDAQFTTDDGNVARVDAGGFFVSSASGSNYFGVQAGQTHLFEVDGAEVAAVAGDGLSASNLTVNGTSFLVPRGPQAARPAGTDGQIFYNEDTGRFEGFASAAWGGLGGTVDVDQNTYVSAEDSPGANNNELKFVTDGEERMRITDTGLMGYGTSNPEYTIDIVGDLRVSGSILASGAVIGEAGKVMELGLMPDGSADVVDGKDTNDGAGLKVVGMPATPLFSSSKKARFEKSLTWNYNQGGMTNLGRKDAWESESYWKMRGGAFRLSHTNPDSGDEIEFIMRVNDQDEFQVVRHVVPTNGDPETYDVVAKFGNKASARRSAAERGSAVLDADRTSMDTVNATVLAYIESFSAYDDYVVRGALYPTSAFPTVSEVVAASATNGYVSATLAAAGDNTTSFTFTAMHDGGAIPDTLLKFAAVIELSDGSLSAAPSVSFVINDASIYEDLTLAADQETQSVINYELNFSALTWDELSAADKAVFESWLEDQVLQTLRAQGVDVQGVEFTFASGSIVADVNVTYPTSSTTKLLNAATSAVSTSVISGAASTPIVFVDRPPETVSVASVSKSLKGVTRIQTAPLVVSAAESSSTASTVTVAYEVSEANANYAVTTLHVLASVDALAAPILPSRIAGNGAVQTFAVSGTSGTAVVNVDTSVRTYLYVVAQNNVTPLSVMSPVYTVRTAAPLNIIFPNNIAINGASGLYQFASQDGTANAVATAAGISVYATAATATAYLLLYEEGDVDIPATAADALMQLDTGATAASVNLS